MYQKITARAHPNIALIKYWGKRDIALNLPAVPSVSLTLEKFHTTTTVEWDSKEEVFVLNGMQQTGTPAKKVSQFLDIIAPERPKCLVTSENNFPTAAGLASSSSAFAALALAASTACGRELSTQEISVLARRGSGSACRSVWGGWVEWTMGSDKDGTDSHARQIAPREHWDIRMVMCVVSDEKKATSSTAGMVDTAKTSPMYQAWCDTASADVEAAKQAIIDKDIHTLGTRMEISTQKMFATMLTTIPSIRYWKGRTLDILDTIDNLRQQGLDCWYTMDAGPNVKILCASDVAEQIAHAVEPYCRATHILSAGGDAHVL